MSKPTWSAMDIAKLAKVLAEAKESGLLDAALAALNSSPDRDPTSRLDDTSSVASWEEVGAMTDASKRRSLAMDGSPDRPHRTGAPGYGPLLPVVPAVVVSALSAVAMVWYLLVSL